MDTRNSVANTEGGRTPFLERAFDIHETPLLDALYDSANEAALDPETQDLRELDRAFGSIITDVIQPMMRQDATAKNDDERFHRMTLAWNKQKGEPKRRKRKTQGVTKTKAKPKWIPRKKYLAKKRKPKLSGKRK